MATLLERTVIGAVAIIVIAWGLTLIWATITLVTWVVS